MTFAIFLLILLLLTTGPGLFLWSRVRFRAADPFFAPCFVLGASLGASMLVLWALYALCLYTRPVLVGMLAVFGIGGVAGILAIVRARRAETALETAVPVASRLLDLAVFALVALFALGMAKCVAGTPFSAWDAAVSWDKWAEDIARRRFLGGYVSGGYPPGLPLLLSVFYKLLLPAGTPAVCSAIGALLPAAMQVFPLLLGLSLLSACRSLRIPSPAAFAIVFGNAAAVHYMVKYAGYADIPLAAFTAAAAAWFCATAGKWCQTPIGKRANHSFSRNFANTSMLFPVAFTKGNGFVFLVVFLGAALLLDRRRYRPLLGPAMAALAAAGVFYLHQWTVGVWCPSLAETSPFQHALPVMASHKDLVHPGIAHFLGLADQWGGFYGLPEGVPARLLVAGTLLALLGAASIRACRVPALVTLLGLVLTYRNASYDARNALFLLVPMAFLLPAALMRGVESVPMFRKPGAARKAAFALLLAVFIAHGAVCIQRNRFLDIAGRVFRRPWIPAALRCAGKPTATPDFLVDSEFGRRAAHILSASTAYRRLPNGVYPLQQNAHSDLRPHDLAFAGKAAPYEPHLKCPGFVPVGEPESGEFGRTLYLNAPVRTPVRVGTDYRYSGPDNRGRVLFHLDDVPSECRESGVVELCVPMDCECSIYPLGKFVPYRPWVGTDSRGRVFRLPYWYKGDRPPEFVLEANGALPDILEAAVLH